MLTSARASCKVLQNPFLAKVTILVEYSATTISIRRGTAESRVRRPINNKARHTQFHYADEWSHDVWPRNADFHETPRAKRIRKQKFLNTFRQEHPAYENAN